MSHVDEGALHAYLDGALDEYPAAEAERIREHLEACGSCAERLEHERLIRSDAQAILGLAAPEVELPSLEELRAYVKRTRPAATSFTVRMYRMGWAASVALALGTGWLLRGGVSPESRASGQADRSVPSARQALERAAVERPAAEQPGEAQAASPQDAMQGAPGAASAGRDSDGGASRQVADGVTAGSAGGTGVAGGDQSSATPTTFEAREELPVDIVAKATDRSEPSADADAEPEALAAPVDLVVSAELVADAADSGEGAGVEVSQPVGRAAPTTATDTERSSRPSMNRSAAEPVGAVPAAALPEAMATAGSEESADSAAVDEELDEETTRSASPLPLTSAMEQSGLAARRARTDDETAVVDGPSLVVPGLEVVSVTNLGQGTTALGVYVVQLLEDGATLEIYHLEPDVGRDRIPALPNGLGEVVRNGDEGLIVLRAPRSQAELDALLARLFPEG